MQTPTKNLVQDNNKHYSRLVQFEQIKLLYERLFFTVITNLVLALLLSTLLWRFSLQSKVIYWFFVSLLPFGLIPLVARYKFKQAKPKIHFVNIWKRLLLFIYFIQASSWSFAALVLFNSSILVNNVILTCVIIIVAVFYVNFTTGYKPVFYISIIPVLLPLGLRLLFENNTNSLLLGFIILFLLAIFVIFYSQLHIIFQNALTQSFKKTRLAKNLEQANLDKSRLLAASSHDLKQPLQAQSLQIAALKRNLTSTKNKRIIENLEKSTNTMRDLFDSLLDLSRLDSGIVEPKIQHFPITKIFDELIVDFSAMALDKDLTFRIVDSSLIIKSDPVLLTRIIRNIVSNAIKYTEKGGIVIGVRRKSNNNISIDVLDSGIGISDNEQKTIFDEYSQLNNPEHQHDKGIGLGLAIVKRLTSLLNHHLSIQSTINQGSVFSILVPQGDNNEIVCTHTFSVNYCSDIKNLSIVIFCENNVLREKIASLLISWKCKVITALSVNDALKQLMKNNFIPDLIISDYTLCNTETGVFAINIINDILKKSVPAILITSNSYASHINQAELNGYKILLKPIAPDKLRSLLSFFASNTKNENNPDLHMVPD